MHGRDFSRRSALEESDVGGAQERVTAALWWFKQTSGSSTTDLRVLSCRSALEESDEGGEQERVTAALWWFKQTSGASTTYLRGAVL
ncbi:hypothetical protein H663_016115 [Limnohabitans planktonicus II-D5]|uniref:Uncharacterized protein n=1 Tax=Limnohabitans planktonicus II-D5 TaxID=1293045 RepID=A0A2T7UAI2_9BURK|nr:hypothetical protein H663_016115 [Limnohabitans planktonicus II-D5]